VRYLDLLEHLGANNDEIDANSNECTSINECKYDNKYSRSAEPSAKGSRGMTSPNQARQDEEQESTSLEKGADTKIIALQSLKPIHGTHQAGDNCHAKVSEILPNS
jgi:hypothetical protein